MGKWTIRRLNVDKIEKTASPKLFDRSDLSSSKHYQKKKCRCCLFWLLLDDSAENGHNGKFSNT